MTSLQMPDRNLKIGKKEANEKLADARQELEDGKRS